MTAPPEILHWCGTCRGERPHVLARQLTRGAQPVTLYGCACGAVPVEISEPASKTPALIQGQRIVDAVLAEQWKNDTDRKWTPRKLQHTAAKPKETTMPKTKTIRDVIAEIVDAQLAPVLERLTKLEGLDLAETVEAVLLAELGGGSSKRVAVLGGDEDFKCPRGPHKGKCPNGWCRRAAA